MTERPLLPASALREPRERAIATLTEAFARDDLTMDELESRLSRAQTAGSLEAIDALVADLAPAAAPAPVAALVPAGDVRGTDTALAILGSTERRGAWLAPRKLTATAVMGSVELDFREARLPSGVVEVEVKAIMGSIEIIVPPGLAVEVHGTGALGSFETVERAPTSPDPDRPLLRVRGIALMGSVEVRTELPKLAAGTRALKPG